MPSYYATRSVATRRRQYEAGDPVVLSTLADDERQRFTGDGSIVPARFVGLAADLARQNPVVAAGLVAYATDTGDVRIGDGVTAWSSLPAPLSGTYAAARVKFSADNAQPKAVATNCWGHADQVNNAHQTVAGTSRSLHRMVADATDLRLVYSNWTTTSTGVDTDGNGATAPAVTASIEYSGTIYRVTFGGKITATPDAGGVLISDPIALVIPAGTLFYVRTYINSTDWYGNSASYAVANTGGWSTSDLTAPGAAAVPDAVHWLFSPSAIIGLPLSRSQASVGIVGDSIATGQGSTTAVYSDPPGATVSAGYIMRGLNLGYGYINLARISDRAQNAAGNTWFRRLALLQFCSNVICQLGINDVLGSGGNRSLAQVQGDYLSIWKAAGARVPAVFQTTVTPSSASTDGWTTTVNQTANTGNTTRVNLNNWLRAGAPIVAGAAVAVGTSGAITCAVYDSTRALVRSASGLGHPLTAVFEVADLVESARDSGLWVVGATSDGLHPNNTGHGLAAGGIVTAALVTA